MGGHKLLQDLSSELLLMMFEELYITAPESFPALRLTCHKLNEIATPFIYRKVLLRTDIIESSPDSNFEDGVCMIRSHVQHVVIKSLLDWDLVATLLLSCRRLETVTWIYWKEKSFAYFPEPLQTVFHGSLHLNLRVNNYTYPSDFGPYTAGHTMSIPAANLVSFTAWSRGNVAVFEPLQDLLVASHRLETLTFNYMPYDGFYPARGRFPPVRTLGLPVGRWPYTSDNVNMIWDFSRLKELKIKWLILGFFLESVSPKDLCRLKCLRVDESFFHTDWQEAGEARRYQELVACQLQKLLVGRNDFEELEINCRLSLFDISLIARQCHSLRVLRLFDTDSFKTKSPLPTISLSSLRMLQTSCVKITSLCLAVNFMGVTGSPFLDILRRFRNLHDLTLYVKSRLEEDTVDTLLEDIDYISAINMKDFLATRKLGANFSRITVNVGGWTEEGGVLRNSPFWDLKRKQGRIPERLFIFEWNYDGILSFHEQRHYWYPPWPSKE